MCLKKSWKLQRKKLDTVPVSKKGDKAEQTDPQSSVLHFSLGHWEMGSDLPPRHPTVSMWPWPSSPGGDEQGWGARQSRWTASLSALHDLTEQGEQANVPLKTKAGAGRAREQTWRASPSEGGCLVESRMDPMEGEEVWELGYSAEISMPGRPDSAQHQKAVLLRGCQPGPCQSPEGQIPLLEQVPSRGQRQENTQNWMKKKQT